jgi:hypothetical protein
MADLIERLMGLHTDGRRKLPIHQFQAAAAEWGRGEMTGVQARDMFELNVAEQAEAQAIVATVTSIVVTGSAAAQADARARRALRMQEIDHVLLLAEAKVPPLNTPAAVRTRLGI